MTRKKRTERRLQLLKAEIERIQPLLASRPDIELVILFGSLARGETGPSSDLDLVIVQRTERRFLDRLDEFYRFLDPRLACDILVYTPEEFKRLEEESRFVARVVREGITIHAA